MKQIVFSIIVAALLILGIFIYVDRRQTPPGLKTIRINGAEIFVEIADTPQTRTKGLSGRLSLPENQGVLFIFETPDRYSFWMKEMNFPLDFLWIDGNEIVEIAENIKPEDFQPPIALAPQQNVDKVLELNTGTVSRLNIKPGDKIEF